MGDVKESGIAEARCAECGGILAEGQDRVTTDGGVFCRSCYERLTTQVRQVLEAQTRDVNYPMALFGALLGAAVGVLAWWGFTVVTKIAFGLVAVVIGFAVARGAVLLSGNKRGTGLQALSVTVSVAAYLCATYLVHRTFIQRALAKENPTLVLPFVPSPEMFFDVVKAGFGLFDLVFLAIVVWTAWRIPAAVNLAGSS